jgi:hypothetical protein
MATITGPTKVKNVKDITHDQNILLEKKAAKATSGSEFLKRMKERRGSRSRMGRHRSGVAVHEKETRDLMSKTTPGKRHSMRGSEYPQSERKDLNKSVFKRQKRERASQQEDMRQKVSSRPKTNIIEPNKGYLARARTSRISKGVSRAASRAGKGVKGVGPLGYVGMFSDFVKTMKRAKMSPEERGT